MTDIFIALVKGKEQEQEGHDYAVEAPVNTVSSRSPMKSPNQMCVPQLKFRLARLNANTRIVSKASIHILTLSSVTSIIFYIEWMEKSKLNRASNRFSFYF